MDKNFWHQRWQSNKIGFHRDSTHPALKMHWPAVSGGTSQPVLVPLCGKSLDMHWLASQGHPVVGVELDRGAAESFFDEAGMTAQSRDCDPLPGLSAGGITIFIGDFFEFEHSSRFSLVYDRAALIALPPETRPRYLNKLASLMANDAQGLLITLEYPQSNMDGPPFSVMPEELDAVSAFAFRCLERSDALSSNERFAEKGLPWLRETVHALKKR